VHEMYHVRSDRDGRFGEVWPLVSPPKGEYVGVGVSTFSTRVPTVSREQSVVGGPVTGSKKAQQVGVKVKELQEELQETEIEAVAAEGGVTVVISGSQVPLSVEVTDELLAKGADAVSEAVSIAAKEAHTNSMEYAKQRMTELYGEIGLPMPPQEGQQ